MISPNIGQFVRYGILPLGEVALGKERDQLPLKQYRLAEVRHAADLAIHPPAPFSFGDSDPLPHCQMGQRIAVCLLDRRYASGELITIEA